MKSWIRAALNDTFRYCLAVGPRGVQCDLPPGHPGEHLAHGIPCRQNNYEPDEVLARW